MIRSLLQFVYGSTPVEFRSAYGLAESVERLRAGTRRSVFVAPGRTVAVGNVTADAVRLRRFVPMVGNNMSPYFFGRFVVRGSAVWLTGRFALPLWSRLFLSLFLAAVTAGGLFVSLAGPPGAALQVAPRVPLGVGFCLSIAALGKWVARNDIPWLTQQMNAALGVPAQGDAASPLPAEAPSPLVPRVAAAFFAFFAIQGLVAIARHRVGPAVAPFSEGAWRSYVVISSITFVCLAGGLVLRKVWAWRLFFAVAVASASVTLAALWLEPEAPLPVKVFMTVGAAVVSLFWLRWWHAQRIHFTAG
ncbi:MAG: hypothetical protein JST92_00800 [Deltaproteobacteria bacterium]|nr:hypothetical protein [Deltaproteobacteria bacterium]